MKTSRALWWTVSGSGVPEDVGAEIRARARLSGRSLQEDLKVQLVELASRPDPEVPTELARERAKRARSRLAAERILEHRDHDRR